ncbi:hypothetical protein LJPFL01_0486 [Lelliottia jeotgali]|nr:hypothetical protein LJPFL01_0486 [Lelliottia jeotgali]
MNVFAGWRFAYPAYKPRIFDPGLQSAAGERRLGSATFSRQYLTVFVE